VSVGKGHKAVIGGIGKEESEQMAKSPKVNKPKFQLDIPGPTDLEKNNQPKDQEPPQGKPEIDPDIQPVESIKPPVIEPTEIKKDHESRESKPPVVIQIMGNICRGSTEQKLWFLSTVYHRRSVGCCQKSKKRARY
jgi:hypothetical protein